MTVVVETYPAENMRHLAMTSPARDWGKTLHAGRLTEREPTTTWGLRRADACRGPAVARMVRGARSNNPGPDAEQASRPATAPISLFTTTHTGSGTRTRKRLPSEVFETVRSSALWRIYWTSVRFSPDSSDKTDAPDTPFFTELSLETGGSGAGQCLSPSLPAVVQRGHRTATRTTADGRGDSKHPLERRLE